MVRSEGNMSLKNPVTPPGIDPGTVRLLAQRLNHYATPGTNKSIVISYIQDIIGSIPSRRHSVIYRMCVSHAVSRDNMTSVSHIWNAHVFLYFANSEICNKKRKLFLCLLLSAHWASVKFFRACMSFKIRCL